MVPYRNVKTQNFKTLLSFTRCIAVGGFLSLLLVCVAIIIQTYKSGMATQLGIASSTVAPTVVIAISGILAILISIEENVRKARASAVGDPETQQGA